MKAVVQRVTSGRVEVDGEIVGEIGPGLLVLLGVAEGDGQSQLDWMVDKVTNLRIFEDDAGKMNLSVGAAGGSILVVSQFTLLADCSRGRRPSFTQAMEPIAAAAMVERFIAAVRKVGFRVEQGVFGAMMEVSLTNSGPVTIVLESP